MTLVGKRVSKTFPGCGSEEFAGTVEDVVERASGQLAFRVRYEVATRAISLAQ